MVNKCAAVTCKTGYSSSNSETVLSTFRFPIKDEELLQKWTLFVNRQGWTPSVHSVLCELHFEEELINRSGKSNLRWNLNPVPTIQPGNLNQLPSVWRTPTSTRKPPLKRIYQEDQLDLFRRKDQISCLNDINQNCTLDGFEKKTEEDYILFYKLVFNEVTKFPDHTESIKIDSELHVQLQFNGIPLPLPHWFTHGHNAKLTKMSMLENFPSYIKESVANCHYSFWNELNERKLFHPKGRPPYSSELIRYALHLRHTSLQSYRLLLKEFPMPSISLLNKIQQGGVDAIKAIKKLRENGNMSKDVIISVDEMYLLKCTQYTNGEYVGADKDGKLYKGIVAFLIVGLKESVPYVIQAIPEVKITGKWLAKIMLENIKSLTLNGFVVRAIVTDNHSTNVNAFSHLVKTYNSESTLFIQHPDNFGKKTYLFYDNVHLAKNLRNNLINGKRFEFPNFTYQNQGINITCPAGYISWCDLHNAHDQDKKLKGNLRKCPKLTYTALHPGSKKQNVPLALAIFHESTIAGIKSYYPNRHDIVGFLQIINTWWAIANSKLRYNANPLKAAVTLNDGKMIFFTFLADWIESWCLNGNLTLTKQTANSFVTTLRSQAMLVTELLVEDGYQFIMTARMQSDPVERRFSRYRQMSGGNFLVSLREMLNSEIILVCRALLKAKINFWEEDLKPKEDDYSKSILESFKIKEDEIANSVLDNHSEEVAVTLAGYVAKKLTKRTNCDDCKAAFSADKVDLENDSYLSLLSRGKLFVPSKKLAEYVCSCFAALDFAFEDNLSLPVPARKAATLLLKNYGPSVDFTCNEHFDWGFEFASKIIINIYCNNETKFVLDKKKNEVLKQFKTRQRRKE